MDDKVHLIETPRGRNHSFNNMTPSLRTPNPRIPEVPATSPPSHTVATPLVTCDTHIDLDYDIVPAVICALCAVFGLLYCFLGYRFFKATMFLTGFLLGSVITYLVCIEEKLLPLAGKVGVTVVIGLLVGLITMLVQYVGLFLTGFCFGGLLGTTAVVILEQFYQPQTIWVCIGIIFLTALLFAVLILYFQRGLTIFGTGLCGAALIAVSLDYFIEKFTLVNYIFACMKNSSSGRYVCWFSWVIMGLWPALFFLGSLTQWKITGRGIDHRETVRVRKQSKKASVHKERPRQTKRQSSKQEVPGPPPSPSCQLDYHDDHPQTRYRHLYQVRRSNGDVISQSYIQSIQHKLSTAVRKKVVTRRETLPPTEIDPSMASLTQSPES